MVTLKVQPIEKKQVRLYNRTMTKEKLEYRQDADSLVRDQRLKCLRIMTVRGLRRKNPRGDI